MAGTITLVTEQDLKGSVTGKEYSCVLTADASGDVSAVPLQINGRSPDCGFLMLISTVPGTPAPTDGYTLELKDKNGADVLGGAGTNRSATLAQRLQASKLAFVSGDLYPTVSGAGNGAKINFQMSIVGTK